MNRRRGLLAGLGCLVLLPILCCGQVLFTDCLFFTCPPSRPFKLAEIAMLPESMLPANSYIHYSTSFEDGLITGQIDASNMYINLGRSDGIAVYGVGRFRTSEQAKHRLAQFINFDPDLPQHESFSYRSVVADEFIVRCGDMILKGNGCELLALYGEYFVSFTTSINEHMTIEQFEEIVIYIDQQIADKMGD